MAQTQPVSRRFADIRAWAALVGVLLIALGAAVLALIAQNSANSAIDCVNNVLGSRSDLTVRSAQAQASFAAADQTYNVADGVYNATVNQIITHSGHAPDPATARTQLAQASLVKRRAALAKEQASQKYQQTMQDITRIALEHPLGRC